MVLKETYSKGRGVNGIVLAFISLHALVVGIVQVQWSSPERLGISIVARDRRDEISRCLESSLQARLRFEVRLCSRRSMWFDHCEDTRAELHTVEFDEVTESYRVVTDRFGDKLEAIAVGIPARVDAISSATTVNEMPLRFIAREAQESDASRGAYVQVRTIFTCRGEVNRTIAHLSRIITFGLVNVVENSAPWSDFSLHPPK